MSEAEDFMEAANDCLMQFNAGSVLCWPNDDVAFQKTIDWVPLRETRYRRQDSGAPSQRYEVMDCYIRAENDTIGQETVAIWGQTAGVKGMSLHDDDEIWYVRKILERDVGGMHKLRLASTPAMIESDWS